MRTEQYLTAEEAARRLECSVKDLDSLVETGDLTPMAGRFDSRQVRECAEQLEREHEAMDKLARLGDELDFGEESYR